MAAQQWKKMSAEEIRLAKMWAHEDGMQPSQIAKLLRRNKSTITRLVCKKRAILKQGAPTILKKKQVDMLERTLKMMIKKSKKRWIVTVMALKKRTKSKASCRTILKALHDRGIYFHILRSKPLLTENDIAARYKFSQDFKGKPATWWLRKVQLHIDCKFFPVYLNGKARSRIASTGAYGAYRAKGDGLRDPYVKSKKDLKWNPGAKHVLVLAGVSQDRVQLWHYIHLPKKARWGGKVAAEMYLGPVRAAVRRRYPQRKWWTILEDNDPAGFKSTLGNQAKKDAKLHAFPIPMRSPQLNVLDYAIWSEVSRRMRQQEKRWPPNKKESRPQYLERLRRTAKRLPARFVRNSIMNMKVRCQRLYAAQGSHFEEGR